jgi:hypothetical protein
MKEALQKLFTPDSQAAFSATTERRISLGVYEITDDAGRTLQVNSSLVLLPSQRVIVQSGRVISLSGNGQPIKTYEV